MSFVDFPSALPFVEELHDPVKLDALTTHLGQKNKTEMDIGHLTITERNKKGTTTTTHPFMDAFDDLANHIETANGGVTNASSKDAILDLYYGINLVEQKEGRLLQQAWAQDPLTALHIIFYARSIHRGKSLKGPFLNAFCWLLLRHPRTALANLRILVEGTVRTDAQLKHNQKSKNDSKRKRTDMSPSSEDWEMVDDDKKDGKAAKKNENYELLKHRDFKPHGYWKDLCTILTIYCQGELQGAENDNYLALQWPRSKRNSHADSKKLRSIRESRYEKRKQMPSEEAAQDSAKFIQDKLEEDQKRKIEARQKKLDRRAERNKRVCNLLESDRLYRALHITVARLFSKQLKEDMAQLEQNKMNMTRAGKHKYALSHNLSLAAKWAPSLKLCHDKHTFLATSIAEALFPPSVYQEKDESRVHYLNKVRNMYRKNYLVPLREAIDLPEHYMQEGKWEQIDLRHMPSVCLQKNMRLFFKHAPDVVIQYMEDVAKGKKKVSGATLGPNELVYRVRTGGLTGDVAQLVESDYQLREKFLKAQAQLVNGQWDTLISSIRNTSLLQQVESDDGRKQNRIDLGECIAVCDVSGSMFWMPGKPENQPINAAIGLSLIISNLAKPPFQGGIITFTAEPKLFHVDTSAPFNEQVNTLLQSEMGYNTDIAKVFTEVLLPMAKKHKLAPKDMVKRLFIFSDMEFDAVDNGMNKFMTTHDFIVKQFEEAGYEVPELVWWNLASSDSYSSADRMNVPVTKDDTGVALLSGFSAAMVKTFLDGEVDQDEVDGKDNNSDAREVRKEKEEKNLTPLEFVKKAVYHESFNALVVID